MSYSGENKYFSFRDGYCEALPGVTVNSSEAAEFGRIISGFFKRFSIGCDGFAYNHFLYAICSGISECGHDVFVCENTDLPSFRFGFPLLSADCGIYVSGKDCLKISIFEKNGFPVNQILLSKIMKGEPSEPAAKSGKISSSTSFRNIYINNIADSLGGITDTMSVGISCGNRSVRSLWHEFFTGEDDNLVFQVCDNGQRVNAYSKEAGFISYEKLILAYAAKLSQHGETVYLPENFHYAADYVNSGSSLKISRFNPEEKIPQEAVEQRFLCDSLFMCAHLASDKKSFIDTVRKLPILASVKRELSFDLAEQIGSSRIIPECGGRVIISRSGKKNVTLLAQAYSAETASELCSLWSEKLRRMSTDKTVQL